MKSIKAVYDNGHLQFPEGNRPAGRMEVVVLFPESNEPNELHDKDAGRRFVEEWSGVLKDANLDNWQDEKAEYLKGK